MKRISLVVLLFAVLTFPSGHVYADGGQVGLSPGTGFKMRFGGGSTDFWIPIQLRGEAYLGEEDQHGVGGTFGWDIGTGLTPNFAAITPHYHYYFKQDDEGKGCGPYVGSYFDLRFRGNLNSIGLGAKGGYRFQFNDEWGIWAESNIGFNTIGGKNFGNRLNGGEFGFNVGAYWRF